MQRVAAKRQAYAVVVVVVGQLTLRRIGHVQTCVCGLLGSAWAAANWGLGLNLSVSANCATA